MDRQEAFEELKNFKDEYLIGRSKIREIRSFFKFNPDEPYYVCTVNDAPVKVEHDLFWDIVTATDINTVCSTTFNQFNEDSTGNTDCNEFDIKENSKIRKDNLALKNKLSFERNNFNKKLREISSLEELNRELIECIKKIKPQNIKDISKPVKYDSENGVGVVVISDTHFNELISTPVNKYDFEIASKRLKKLAEISKKTFKQNNIKKIAILMLGDLINSDRRQSEYMNMVTNRSKAMVLSFYLLKQFIEDISNGRNTVITSVSGNESRCNNEEFDTSDILATYNYDYSIHQFLKVYFKDSKNISFIDGNFGEKVINLNGQNVLLTHGVALKNDLEKSVTQTFGRYGANGVTLDYLFCGHLHSARVGDLCSRCGSLCGSNSYSEGALNLNSRASQLIGIFYPNKTRCITNVDLQNVDNIEGYDIIDELQEYNAKSADKKHKFLIHNI